MPLSPLDDTEKLVKKIRTDIGLVPNPTIKKLPKISIQQYTRSPSECAGILTSCIETNNPLGCSVERLGQFLSCITGGKETIVTGVPCDDEEVGTHYMPYSVYQDWLRCVSEASGGEAECDTFYKIDELGRKITTKIQCDCPHEKTWSGRGCKCPQDKPFDEYALQQSGAEMVGECCAKFDCGEGGVYFCADEICECAPGWYPDGEGGCRDDPCTPGPQGGQGCEEGYCCQTLGVCVLDNGQWDGVGDPDVPKTISECEKEEGRWITTDEDACPEEGHCELSICNLNRTYVENELVISECDPYCTASKCALACSESDPTKCGGSWKFDSCDNVGTPKSCLCACIPP